MGGPADERYSCNLVTRAGIPISDCLIIEFRCDSQTIYDRVGDLADDISYARQHEGEQAAFRLLHKRNSMNNQIFKSTP